MDLVDSLKLVNIEYGSLVKVTFRFLEEIQVKPEIPPESLMANNDRNRVMILSKSVGKLS